MSGSAAAVGAVVGSLWLTAWGGFRRRMKTLLLAEALMALFSLILFGPGQSLWGWAPNVQGRIFAARRLIAWIWQPATPLLAGVVYLLPDHDQAPAPA